MQWRNSPTRWGLLSVLLHWTVALTVFGLFGLGLWMTGLDYYHPWYKEGPNIHRSVGLILAIIVLLRLSWRLQGASPAVLPRHERWEVLASLGVHALLYLLPLALVASGYLISTADGRAISVFGWFDVPALFSEPLFGMVEQEVTMGELHALLAWSLIGTAAIHILGALKHHFLDRDNTLIRMLGKSLTEKELHNES